MYSIRDLTPSSLRKLLVFLIIFCVFFQIEVFGGEGGASLGSYHLILVPGLLFLFKLPELKFGNALYWAFFALFMISSIINWVQFGFTLRGVLLPITMLAFWVGLLIPHHVSFAELRRMGEVTAWAICAFVLFRFLINFDLHVSALSGGVLDIFDKMTYISTGGAKPEASNLALLTILIVGTRAYIPLSAATVFLSVIYQARGALLMLASSGLQALILVRNAKVLVAIFFAISLVLLLGTSFIVFSDSASNLFMRMLDSQSELAYREAKVGRLSYIIYGIELVAKYPLGVGVGNSMTLLREHVGMEYQDNNNLHNIFLIILLEGGIQTFILYLMIVAKVFFDQIKCGFRNCLGTVVCIYFLAGTFQYMGYDVIGWIFIGIYASSRKVWGDKYFENA